MTTHCAWQMLGRQSDAATAIYAVLDSAATAATMDDDEILCELNRRGVEKHTLFSGKNAWANDNVAPYLVRLDTQPGIRERILEKGWGNGWGVFFTSDADIKGLLVHFRSFFDLHAENRRKVFFRFYDPVILGDFLPRLNPQEASAFFGPVKRFVIEDPQGRALVFERPEGGRGRAGDLDPAQIATAKRALFSPLWNKRLLKQHVQAYRALGFDVKAEPDEDALTLFDKAGGNVRLKKTGYGVAVTTGEKRIFKYELSTCKNPTQIIDPAGRRINIDIQERQNRPDPVPGENLIYAIRMDNGQKSWVFEYDDKDHLKQIDYPDGTRAQAVHDSRGNLIRYKDRNGHSTGFELDFDQRLTGYTDANGHRTRFEYDGLHAPHTIGFANGRTFDFTYTDAGALEKFLVDNQQVAEYQVDRQLASGLH